MLDPKNIESRTSQGFIVRLDTLRADLEKAHELLGNTFVYIRSGGLSIGSVALNRYHKDKAQDEESKRHPEPAPDPQETADGGEKSDIPDPANSLAMSNRREIESATDWDKASAPGFRYTSKDTAKTSMSEPVPPRTLEGETDPSHNGTQLEDIPEGILAEKVGYASGVSRRPAKPGDKMNCSGVLCVAVPAVPAAPKGDVPMKTFEKFALDMMEIGITDFRLRFVRGPNGEADFYMHPVGHDGETLDYTVKGDTLEPIPDNHGAGSRPPKAS